MPFNSVQFPPTTTDKYPAVPVTPPPRDNVRSGNIALRVDWDNPITQDADGKPLDSPLYRVVYNGEIQIGHWSAEGKWESTGPTLISHRDDILSPEVVALHPDVLTIAPLILKLQMDLAREDGYI